MSSPKKRLSSRANSLKSTGPRTQAGRRRSSVNALRHGLSVPSLGSADPLHLRLVAILSGEVADVGHARWVASAMLDYERNLHYQRELYLERFAPPGSMAPMAAGAGIEAQLGQEFEAMQDVLEHLHFVNGRHDLRDLVYVARFKLKAQARFSRTLARQHRAQGVRASRSLRYLRRSSNQLVKALRGLRWVGGG